ncbi:MAG: ferrochelatase, partial [Deltaproteobacteria bacterium]|nr:ferrochelatase [Deltaproteobacteria bacterium]
PKSMVEEGDPYVDHLYRTIAALEGLTGLKGHLCYQSKSGPVEWLEPATDILLNELAEKGFHSLLVLPISFVSDHIETLYEIDMLYSEMMAEKGVRLIRTPSLNDRPLFINALSNLAEQGLKKAGWLK